MWDLASLEGWVLIPWLFLHPKVRWRVQSKWELLRRWEVKKAPFGPNLPRISNFGRSKSVSGSPEEAESAPMEWWVDLSACQKKGVRIWCDSDVDARVSIISYVLTNGPLWDKVCSLNNSFFPISRRFGTRVKEGVKVKCLAVQTNGLESEFSSTHSTTMAYRYQIQRRSCKLPLPSKGLLKLQEETPLAL